MSDNDKNLGDELKGTAKKIKDGAKDIAKDLDESTKDFQEDAKETVNEFTQSAKEAYEDLTSNKENKKVLAGILAIIFGALGIHKFILGYTKEGIIMLVISIISFGLLSPLMGLIGFVEGIIYLTKSDDEFYKIYQINKKTWF